MTLTNHGSPVPGPTTSQHIVDFYRTATDWKFECECGARWSMGVIGEDGDRILASINNHLHSAGLKPSEVL